MTNEHLNTQIYWKLHREHEAFKSWLMRQPSSVIIENAYKYAMMEDVLLTFENNNLSDEQAKALLKGKGHLEKIVDRWQENGTGHMDSMWKKAQEYANEMAEKQARIYDRGR